MRVDRGSILAPGLQVVDRALARALDRPPILLPAFTAGCPAIGLVWGVVSSYSSATASGFHGIPACDPLTKTRKELSRGK
jgi:hypothetical protein